MYKKGDLSGQVVLDGIKVRLRSDATKSSLKEISSDLEGDGKMLSEQEE